MKKKVKKSIKTYEDAVKSIGKKRYNKILKAKVGTRKYRKKIKASKKLQVIAEVLNEGWKPDFNDHNQLKYYPYFSNPKDKILVNPLCFKTQKMAEYMTKNFYNDILDSML